MKAYTWGMFGRWFLVWISIYEGAQLLGLTLVLLHRAGTEHLAEAFDYVGYLLLLVYLVQGLIAVPLIWVFGRRRRRTGFRVLSILLLIVLWMPLTVYSAPPLVAAWLCATLAVAVAIRQPVPAYYGPTRLHSSQLPAQRRAA
ncbi:hypothetical protein [Actinoplanes subglobosus]|uniref:Integral membrane protein n=1 Tax=Actinoplanes subglobosus TaxID=1547892 RepID=A0ABV8JCP0_9ACTN